MQVAFAKDDLSVLASAFGALGPYDMYDRRRLARCAKDETDCLATRDDGPSQHDEKLNPHRTS